MIRIVCWKWSPVGPQWDRVEYTADHVNRFASMVSRHLTLEHEIVCITDDPEGIDPSVRIVPLWDDLREFGMCWTRLRVFSPEMRELIGPRFVSIDLDCVITGSLDPLFNIPDSFKAWKNISHGTTYCGSMFLMDAGARSEVWDRFSPDEIVYLKISPRMKRKASRFIHPDAYAAGMRIGSDQAWMSYVLGPGEKMWTRKDGVLSHTDPSLCPDKMGRASVAEPPEGCRIVFFHGAGDPSQARVQMQHPWIVDHWR